ncbi:MAG: ChbG/HpnK family deacetylase [Candidatus Rokubacteria bacterium]|nr:ChbG/HpnK family deacetylase [Candidatus Rokubacteria bacterium]
MKYLIVNADDFGLTVGVSRGILEASRHGIVTSTTLLVNLPVSVELLAELKATRLGVGLHLNLTLGRPLSPASAVPSLVDAEGKFVRDARQAAARAKPDEAERELEAQVAAFATLLGRAPTHLDSHHHVGRHSPIREILWALARQLGIPVRSQDEALRRAARAAGLRTPDAFFGESGPDPYWSTERLLSQLAVLPDGISEFMTHPGYFDTDLAGSRYGPQREVELQGLTDLAVRRAVEALGIRLCHFGDLR